MTAFTDNERQPFADPQEYRFRGDSVRAICKAQQTTKIDYQVKINSLINGVHVFLLNQNWNDYLKFQFIDPRTMKVVDEFGKRWEIDTDCSKQEPVILDYPARIPQYAILRFLYHNTGQTDVQFKANLYLHGVFPEYAV